MAANTLYGRRPDRGAVRAYLRYFWSGRTGLDQVFELTDDHLDHLVSVYAEPGAF